MAVQIGRRILPIVTILLIVSCATLVLALRSGEPIREMYWWEEILLLGSFLLGPLVVVMPGIAFLIHSVKHREQGITARLRYSATASAVAPGLAGLILIRAGWPSLGWLLVGLAAAVIARAWTGRRAETTADGAILGYKYSLAGLVLVVFLAGHPPHSRETAWMFATRSDLRDLELAQRRYFADHKRYTTNLAELEFSHSSGVNPPKVTVGQDWWHATNTHSQLSNVTCGIAVNTANPVIATARYGEPACK